MKTAVFIIGPAGVGKTTLCSTLQDYFMSQGTNVHYMNLDPASTDPVINDLDIRKKWEFPTVMRLEQLGPNGTLMRILDAVVTDREWLEDCLGDYDDDFFIVDCPGQIEAYLHHNKCMSGIIRIFKDTGYSCCAVFALDSTFLCNKEKLLSGMLITLSGMAGLDIPVFNVVTKMDLAGGCDDWDETIEDAFDIDAGDDEENLSLLQKSHDIISRHGVSCILPVDISDIDTIAALSLQIRNVLQIDADEDGKEQHDQEYGDFE